MNLVGGGSSAEGGAFFDEAMRTGRDKLTLRRDRGNGWRASRLVPAVEFLQAQRMRAVVMRRFAEVVSRYDVFLMSSNNPPITPPNAPGGGGLTGNANRPPNRTRQEFEVANTCCYPAVSVPNGFYAKGKPTSITFLGRLYNEADMLGLARAYQEATPWLERRPELPESGTGL
jgi:Asp-tRNA(Asn)/Glu-tRNA(Gln) amidotransferase A subunit family amidase